MDRLVTETIVMKKPYISRGEGSKLNKSWDASFRLLRHFNAHRSGKFQEQRHSEEHATKKSK
jgi:hypothetical protein